MRAQIPHDLGRRGEGHRRHEDGLARLQPQGLDGEVQGRRGRVDRDRVRRADGRRELLLEALDARPGRQPAGAQARDDLLDLGVP